MDWARGHANDDSRDRHVACNYAAGANNSSVADATALRYRDLRCEPNVVLYYDMAHRQPPVGWAAA